MYFLEFHVLPKLDKPEDASNNGRASFETPSLDYSISCLFDKDYVIAKCSPIKISGGKSTFTSYAIDRPVKKGQKLKLRLLRTIYEVADYADFKNGLLVCASVSGKLTLVIPRFIYYRVTGLTVFAQQFHRCVNRQGPTRLVGPHQLELSGQPDKVIIERKIIRRGKIFNLYLILLTKVLVTIAWSPPSSTIQPTILEPSFTFGTCRPCSASRLTSLRFLQLAPSR